MSVSPQRPVAMLLGFLGAQPKHLKKYENMIRSLKVDTAPLASGATCIETIQVIPHQPPVMDFFRLSTLDERAEELRGKVMSELRDADGKLNDRPLLTYSLSNNGTYHYAYFQAFMKTNYPSEYEHIMKVQRGFVFDSTPSLPTPEVFAKGFSGAFSGRFMGKSVERIPYLSPLVEGFFRVYLKQGHLAHIKDTIIETISSQLNPKAAQLYLCSQKDTLVPFQETRQHALSQAQLLKSLNTTPHIDRVSLLSPNSQSVLEKVERLEDQIFFKDFVTSGHVDHMRPYYAEYSAIVQAYFEFCLRNERTL